MSFRVGFPPESENRWARGLWDRKNSAEILFPRYVHLIFAGSYVARSEKMLSHSTVTRAKQQGDPGRAIGLLSPP